MPGLVVQTGFEPKSVARFDRTERTLHWIHAVAFTGMLATGLVLYLPFLAQGFSDRPVMKAIHLVFAVAWLTALLLVGLLGNRVSLRRSRRDFERFDDDDIQWLRRLPARPGRFNAGQKLHAIVQAALSILFVVSGVLLWLGERNTAYRFSGSIALHDVAMFTASAFVVGHLYMVFSPQRTGVVDGMLNGTVSARYAATHHPRWAPDEAATPEPARPGLPRLALAVVVVLVGIMGATLLVRDIAVGEDAGAAGLNRPSAAIPH